MIWFYYIPKKKLRRIKKNKTAQNNKYKYGCEFNRVEMFGVFKL